MIHSAMSLLNNLASFNIQGILITILVLRISLSFHEMAHAWAAYRLGDDTAALQGRLTTQSSGPPRPDRLARFHHRAALAGPSRCRSIRLGSPQGSP